jgi:hypothetical protein
MKAAIAATVVLLCLPARADDAAGEEGEDSMFTATIASGQSSQATLLAARFAQLAGSPENALALVQALQAGAPVRLTEARESAALPDIVVFKAPTGRMAWNEVRIALGLAQDSLARAGVASPTIAQLQAALIGGEFLREDGQPISMRGVLQMRADGLDWDHIARAAAWKVLR